MTNYLPARLRRGKSRWDITYYLNGERVRKTYDLNRIKDVKERELYAHRLIHELNSMLRSGKLTEEPDREINIIKAIHLAIDIKFSGMMENSKRTYKSNVKAFIAWLEAKRYDHLNVSEISRLHSVDFMDYAVRTRGIGARTYNNSVTHFRALWTELIDRGYVKLNPWKEVGRKREPGKTRRPLHPDEKDIIFSAIMKHNTWMAFAVLLIYYCFIRPAELRRLTVSMIDMEAGLVRLPPTITKNHQRANITIPDKLMDWIRNNIDLEHAGNFFLFGPEWTPSSNRIPANKLNKTHKRIVMRLHREGKLRDVTGVQSYSWKDTGALLLFEMKVDLLQIMKQLRHGDLSTTQKYCQVLNEYAPEIKMLDNRIPGL